MLILSINWTNAFIVTFLGIVVVFIVLCLLVVLLYGFRMVSKLFKNDEIATDEDKEQCLEVVSGAESAAIAMALNLYYADIHDEESDIITIKNISNGYSPWNSKIY